MPIHPMAVVEPGAQVHPEATVGPFCMVGSKVVLEAGVILKNHATVEGRTRIGEGSIIFPHAVVGGDPQDLKFRGEDSEVVIGQRCRIHECVTISKGTEGGGMVTRLGNDCLVMAYAHIAHDCQLADRVIIGNNTQLAGHVRVGYKAIVSGMVGVHHFASIGELSFVSGMSGVRTDVPPYVTVEGYPAEPRQVNLVGLRRENWSNEDIAATREAFRILFHDRNGTLLKDALARVRSEPISQCAPVRNLCAWIDEHLELSVKGRLQEAFR